MPVVVGNAVVTSVGAVARTGDVAGTFAGDVVAFADEELVAFDGASVICMVAVVTVGEAVGVETAVVIELVVLYSTIDGTSSAAVRTPGCRWVATWCRKYILSAC